METIDLLVARGYRPVELTSVMYQPIVARDGNDGPVRARIAEADEVELWGAIAARGWGEFAQVAPIMRELARVSASAEGFASFFAEIDGKPVGTGAVAIEDGVALLAGASTIPEARRQGAQRALL